MLPALVEETAVRCTVHMAFGFTDWRHVYGTQPKERPIIELEPYIEMFYGEPFTVWRPIGARTSC